jgi:hypothetical protein
VVTRRLPALCLLPVLLPVLLSGCSGGSAAGPGAAPAASAPAPGVTLPPSALARLVPTPQEVPAGMTLVTKGSGPRSLAVVAGYSGSGAAATAAAAKLTNHGFVSAYVAQYLNAGNGQVLSIVASTFATAAGATSDFADDEKVKQGTPVTLARVGEASSATVQDVAGKVVKQLVLLRFRRGTTTWSLAYQAAKPADPTVALALAQRLLARIS